MALSDYTREFKYNTKLATPVILGMLGHQVVALVDNIMVGQLGSAELAAVSLGNSFMFVAMSIGVGFSTAITPLVAEADGEGNRAKGKSSFKHGLFLCIILGLALFGIVMAAKPLMYVMSQPPEVVDLAMPYLTLVAASLVPLIIFQGFKQFSDGLSMTRFPMYATIIANLVNVLLNYMFIFGKFGAPEMGVVGAAIGTLVSRVVMVGYLWYLLSRKEKSRFFVTNIKIFTLSKKMLKKLLNLGFPSAMQMFFEVGIFTSAVWLSGILGKNPQAANQIALNLASMTFMVAMGFSVAAMIRVGNQKGLKNFRELRRVAISIFLLTSLLSLVFAIGFILFNGQLPKIFLDYDSTKDFADNFEVVTIAAQLLIIAAIFQFTDALQVVALGALRGMQDVKIPTVLTFIAYWIIGFPISYYLSMHTSLESMGIWIGLLAGLTASGVMLFIRFNYLSKKLIRLGS
ncbi:putative efflux protein, MATE family [Aequorivita sublithincola DSM 14238]|uniref:Multidrug-efflux transporter n=1 Tax=Aequorivita sublithincola (strain DSM 14238 / LMG 21431 / ACAM 643 / 9-3) TaxID=746697 RepID=I3YX63_AEQSU|nr:MATE family efflux transporter [Aequorivita sublithincola]AFL81581.1 putative efflux protein, MATE family [Aequorivita sublithincola DSM 14238]